MTAAPALTAPEVDPKKTARIQRAQRARADGRRRTAVGKTPKVVIPETQTAAAARALANLKTAEARRPKAPAPAPPRSRPAPAALKLAAEPTAAFDLADAVQSMPANFLRCRDYGHHWTDFDFWWNAKERRYEDTVRCESCTSTRTRYVGPNGERLGEGGRDYAPGYQLTGVGHVLSSLDRNQFRLATMRAKKRTR